MLIACVVVSIVIGVFVYRRLSQSVPYVRQGIVEMDKKGAEMSGEQCMDAALTWYEGCGANNTNAVICLDGVKILTFHCLKGRERRSLCEDYDAMPDNGKWVYGRCLDKGMKCVNKRECACAEVYRSIESFCRTGGKAVQL